MNGARNLSPGTLWVICRVWLGGLSPISQSAARP
ncbi:hypothetical protein CSUI_009238 [Cystoisospora suis]|uniref:Uncharacterized protein n=1 Tax=Cystoisospora suis TaxID=483139 RepID=A0A2C6KKM9_9APIC|nr:hypothetical protein CSUI_009238 [Cystoisospora suis]